MAVLGQQPELKLQGEPPKPLFLHDGIRTNDAKSGSKYYSRISYSIHDMYSCTIEAAALMSADDFVEKLPSPNSQHHC